MRCLVILENVFVSGANVNLRIIVRIVFIVKLANELSFPPTFELINWFSLEARLEPLGIWVSRVRGKEKAMQR